MDPSTTSFTDLLRGCGVDLLSDTARQPEVDSCQPAHHEVDGVIINTSYDIGDNMLADPFDMIFSV